MSKPLTIELITIKAKTSQIERIKKLNVWGNDIDDVALIAKMPLLEVVSLSVNKIRYLKPFNNLQNLKELYLRQNLISSKFKGKQLA